MPYTNFLYFLTLTLNSISPTTKAHNNTTHLTQLLPLLSFSRSLPSSRFPVSLSRSLLSLAHEHCASKAHRRRFLLSPLPSFLSSPVQTLTIPRLSNSRCCRGDGRCQALRNSGGPVLSPWVCSRVSTSSSPLWFLAFYIGDVLFPFCATDMVYYICWNTL